jgi:5-methylcytosine-specific restriction protein A
MPGRNPTWSRDELIVALDHYVRLDFSKNAGKLSQTSPDIVEISKLLNDLPIHSVRPDAKRFRNPNSVYMKLCNFLRFDPTYQGAGLASGGKLEERIWSEFIGDPQRLHAVAEAILATRGMPDLAFAVPDDIDDEEGIAEGAILLRQHQIRERSRALVKRKKDLVLREIGVVPCQVCDFIFAETYGPDLGAGFIECHHIVPLAQLRPGRMTRMADLALVCSNCHRMLHRGVGVSVTSLRERLVQTRIP